MTIQLLITTPLQVFLFDPELGRLTLLRSGDTQYFGISWNSKGLVLSHSVIDYYNLSPEDYPTSVKGYLGHYSTKSGTVRGTPALLAPHQIECVDDKVLVANTGRNCISEFDSHGNLLRDVYLTDTKWDVTKNGKGGSHFNSVHRQGDRVWVVAHNYGRPSEVWELSWPGLEVIDVMATDAFWAHNIWPGELGKIVCNSKDASLYEVESGNTIWKASEEAVMTRGLAASDDYIYVGRTEIQPRRSERKISNGGLWVVDRRTLETVESYIFPRSGSVHDIRLVGAPDSCHNGHALDRNWLRAAKHVSLGDWLGYQIRKRPYAYQLYRRVIRRFSYMLKSAVGERS